MHKWSLLTPINRTISSYQGSPNFLKQKARLMSFRHEGVDCGQREQEMISGTRHCLRISGQWKEENYIAPIVAGGLVSHLWYWWEEQCQLLVSLSNGAPPFTSLKVIVPPLLVLVEARSVDGIVLHRADKGKQRAAGCRPRSQMMAAPLKDRLLQSLAVPVHTWGALRF